MLLHLTVIDTYQNERRFSCFLYELEVVFEFLDHVIAEGNTLIRADLVENNQSVSLPIAAFDGVSLLPVLRKLELEWMAVLDKPLRSDSPLPVTVADTYGYREKVYFYEQRIASLELMITDADRLYRRAEDALMSGSKPGRNPYQSVLTCYKSQLHQAYRLRKEIFERM